jgi:hypothetical protein
VHEGPERCVVHKKDQLVLIFSLSPHPLLHCPQPILAAYPQDPKYCTNHRQRGLDRTGWFKICSVVFSSKAAPGGRGSHDLARCTIQAWVQGHRETYTEDLELDSLENTVLTLASAVYRRYMGTYFRFRHRHKHRHRHTQRGEACGIVINRIVLLCTITLTTHTHTHCWNQDWGCEFLL